MIENYTSTSIVLPLEDSKSNYFIVEKGKKIKAEFYGQLWKAFQLPFTWLILLFILIGSGNSFAQTISKYIVVDQFGYRTSDQKIAVLRDPMLGNDAAQSFTPGTSYSIVNSGTNAKVFTAAPIVWQNGKTDSVAGDRVWWFDFSSVTAPGTYFVLDEQQNLRSYTFEIKDDVYNTVLKQAVRFFFYQRAGHAKKQPYADAAWEDGASHLGPLQDKNCRYYLTPNDPASERDLRGGWYDAGDLNKYTNWTAGYIKSLLLAYDENPAIWTDDFNIPESNNGIADILDEVKWGMDYLVRLQNADGSVIGLVNMASASPPSSATGQNLYGNVQTSAALSAAASYAFGARIYKRIGLTCYADTLQNAAIKAWNWAVANPNVVWQNSGTGVGVGNPETDDHGRMMLKLQAAEMLFALTGDTQYRTFFDNNYTQVNLINWYYALPYENENQEILLYYTTIPNATASVVNTIKSRFQTGMERDANFGAYDNKTCSYMSSLGSYTWGSNSTKSLQGLMFHDVVQYNISSSRNADAIKAAEGYIHYIHGLNPLNLCYLTNMGNYGAEKSASCLWHTWFSFDSPKWSKVGSSTYGPAPGFLVGGANSSYNVNGCCPNCGGGSNPSCTDPTALAAVGQPAMKSYADINSPWPLDSWSISEPSCGYQVGYIRLLSKFVKQNGPVPNIQTTSVNIASSATTVCSGTGVSFTATGVNAGTLPVYTWYLNNNLTASGKTFSYSPSNGDVIKVVVSAGGTPACLSGNSATSSGIIVTVNALPVITPYLQINTGAWNQISTATVCSGSTVAFGPWPNTALGWTWTGPNGYTSAQRDPFLSNLVSSSTGTYIANYTDGNGCKSSYSFPLTINQNQTNSVSIASSSTNVCSGTGVTFTATGVNGGTAPTYSWIKNNVQVSTGQTYNYTPSNGDAITAKLTAGGTLPTCLSTSTAISTAINLTVNPVPSASVTITSSATTVCSGTGVTFTATGINGGTAPTYSWIKNNVQVSTGQTYNYTPSNGDAITAKLMAGGTLPTCLSTSTAISTAINLTVNPVPSVSVTITSSAMTVCSGTGVTFTATGINGGTAPTYAWLRNNVQVSTGQTYNYTPSNGDAITTKLMAGGTLPTCLSTSTAISTAINLTVNPVPSASVTITSSATTVCSGIGVTFTATGINGGTAPTYSWLKNNLQVSTGQTYSFVPTNGDAITAKLMAGGTLPTCLSTSTAISTAINLTVNPVPSVSVTITSSATTVCSGTGVTFTATGINGGTAPTYSWIKNNVQVSTGQTYNYTPSNGDAITAQLTAGGTLPTCLSTSTAVSSTINLTVNPVPSASVTISSSATTVCSGTVVTFTASGVNGGTAPIYAWLKNNLQVSTGQTYSFVPTNGDAITAKLTAGGTLPTCLSTSTAVSSAINLTVNPALTASVSVSPSSNPVCSGTGITFTAISQDAGSLPTFKWLVNNTLQTESSNSFTYIPSNNDVVKAIVLTGGSGIICNTNSTATSAGITTIVNGTIATSIAIAASSSTICAGSTVTVTASATGTGSSPIFTWLVNNVIQSGNTNSFVFNANNNDQVKAIMTPGGNGTTCITGGAVTSTSINLIVNAIQTASVSISSSLNTVCSGANVAFTATGVNTGSLPTYSWFVNNLAQGTGTTFSYSPSNGDVVKAKLTAGGTLPACLIGNIATSNGINLTVNPIQMPSVSIVSSATTVCSGTGVNFTATGFNGGSVATYNWFTNNVYMGTGPTFSYLPNNGDVVKAILVVGGTLPTCLANTTAVSNLVSIVTNLCLLPQPGSISGPSFVATGTSSVVYSVPNVPGDSYLWTVPSGATIIGGQGTNSITVSYGSTIGSGIIGLQQTNSNGTTSVSLAISTGVPPSSTIISGPTSVNPNQTGVLYFVSSVPGTSFLWSVPMGAIIINGQGTSSIVVDFPTSVSGFVGLGQSNNFGSVFDSLGVVTSVPTSYTSSVESLDEITLFPNPSSGTFQIKLGNSVNSATVTVMDDNGLIQLITHELTSLGGSLRSGHYIVTIQTQNRVKHLPFAKLE